MAPSRLGLLTCPVQASRDLRLLASAAFSLDPFKSYRCDILD